MDEETVFSPMENDLDSLDLADPPVIERSYSFESWDPWAVVQRYDNAWATTTTTYPAYPSFNRPRVRSTSAGGWAEESYPSVKVPQHLNGILYRDEKLEAWTLELFYGADQALFESVVAELGEYIKPFWSEKVRGSAMKEYCYEDEQMDDVRITLDELKFTIGEGKVS